MCLCVCVCVCTEDWSLGKYERESVVVEASVAQGGGVAVLHAKDLLPADIGVRMETRSWPYVKQVYGGGELTHTHTHTHKLTHTHTRLRSTFIHCLSLPFLCLFCECVYVRSAPCVHVCVRGPTPVHTRASVLTRVCVCVCVCR